MTQSTTDKQTEILLAEGSLGRKTQYLSQYHPELLLPIPRKYRRETIGIAEYLPFFGYDIWNAFELSWLNLSGKPVVAVGRFLFPCNSPMLIESKSMKLYLNSFNNSKFNSSEQVTQLIATDFSNSCQAQAIINLQILPLDGNKQLVHLSSQCLDNLDVIIEDYSPKPELLKVADNKVSERLHTNLFKSNCLVTGQPDWGSIEVIYRGKQIDHQGLLKYLVSYRNHHGFAEHCVEQIFMDISHYCQPEDLSVEGFFTRRGGLDINPFRSSKEVFALEVTERLIRQ